MIKFPTLPEEANKKIMIMIFADSESNSSSFIKFAINEYQFGKGIVYFLYEKSHKGEEGKIAKERQFDGCNH